MTRGTLPAVVGIALGVRLLWPRLIAWSWRSAWALRLKYRFSRWRAERARIRLRDWNFIALTSRARLQDLEGRR